MTLPAHVLDPRLPAAAPMATAETHLSWLVLVGDRVFKAKKPVWTEFVDLRTHAERVRVTEDEVRLNRRLAPDVYLGVARLAGVDGLNEPVLVMRRMPEDRRLSTLARAGTDLDDVIAGLAGVLVEFHRGTALAPGAAGTGVALRQWTDNTAEMREHGATLLAMDQLDRVQSLAERYLAGRGPLFDLRAADERFRDGHGDLLADDIFCLADGPRVLDCLEFDARLRSGDVLADIAFLAMDLERLGRPDLASLLLSRYRQLGHDDWPPSLADHWIAYRAQVRSKVACWRASQGDEASGGQARALLELCERRLRQAQVRLVLIGGTPGTGKSTLAAHVAERTGWAVVRSDVVRKTLAGRELQDHTEVVLNSGLYEPAVSQLVLRELLRQARQHLRCGRSVVLDASFADEHWRSQAERTARACSAELDAFQAVLPAAECDRRLASRTANGDDASDATVETAPALRARFAAWPQAHPLDTGHAPSQVADALLGRLGMVTDARTLREELAS